MRLKVSFFFPFVLFAVPLFVGTSCGPVEYMGQVGVKASKDHAALKTAKGEKYSPYEYWSSKYYLNRARYKAGYGDYQDSVRYGKKAQKMCKRGREISLVKRRREEEAKDSEQKAAAMAPTETEPKPVKLKLQIKPKNEKGGDK